MNNKRIMKRLSSLLAFIYLISSIYPNEILAHNFKINGYNSFRENKVQSTTSGVIGMGPAGTTTSSAIEVEITTFEELEKFSKEQGVTLVVKNDITFKKNLYIDTKDITIKGDSTTGKANFILTDSGQTYSFVVRGDNNRLENLKVSQYDDNIGIRVQNATNLELRNIELDSNTPIGSMDQQTGVYLDIDNIPQYTGNVGINVDNSKNIRIENLISRNHRNAGIQLRNGSTIILSGKNQHINDKVALQSIDKVSQVDGTVISPNEVLEDVDGASVDTTSIAKENISANIFTGTTLPISSDKYIRQNAYDGIIGGEDVKITDYVIYKKVNVSTKEQLIKSIYIPNSYMLLSQDMIIDTDKLTEDIRQNNIILDGENTHLANHQVTLVGKNSLVIKGKNILLQNIDVKQENEGTAIVLYGSHNVTLKNMKIDNTDSSKSNTGIDIASSSKGIVLDTIHSSNHKQQGIRIRGGSEVTLKGHNLHVNDITHVQTTVDDIVNIDDSNYYKEVMKNNNTNINYAVYSDIVVRDFQQLKDALQNNRRRIIIADDIEFTEDLTIDQISIWLVGHKGYTNGDVVPNETNRPKIDLQGHSFSIRGNNQRVENLKIIGYARDKDSDTENRVGMSLYNIRNAQVLNVEFAPDKIMENDANGVPKNVNKAVGLDIVGTTDTIIANITTQNHSYQGIRIRDLNGKISEVIILGNNQHTDDEYDLQIVASQIREDYISNVFQKPDINGKVMYVEGYQVNEGGRINITYYTRKEVNATSASDLETALGSRGNVIELTGNIIVPPDTNLTVKDGTTIDGKGHTIDLAGSSILQTKGRDITIKNVTIKNSKEHGIHAYNSLNVTIEDVVVSDNQNGYGIFVNGSGVEIRGNTSIRDNGSGGIWVTRSRTLLLESQRDSEVTVVGKIDFKEHNINMKLTNLEMVEKVTNEDGTITANSRMQNNIIVVKDPDNNLVVDSDQFYDVYLNDEESKKISTATADILIDHGILSDAERDRYFAEQTTDYMIKRTRVNVTNEKDLQNLIDRDGRIISGLNVAAIKLKGDGKTDNTTALSVLLELASRNGTELYFPPGVYKITDDIALDLASPQALSNIKLTSDIDNPAIIDGTAYLSGVGEAHKRMLKIKDIEYHHPMNYVEVKNLIFNNVGFEINGPYKKGVQFIGNGFANGEFTRTMNTDGSKIWRIKMVPYIEVKNSKYTIDGNVLMRDEAHPGKGIATYSTKNTVIENNYIGDLGNLEHAKTMLPAHTYKMAQAMDKFSSVPDHKSNTNKIDLSTYYEDHIEQPQKSATDGNFFTGINILRYDKDVLIKNNYFNLTPTRDVITKIGYDVLIEGIGTNERRRDHLIYAKSYDGLSIVGNYFEGMENGAAGGVKIRNGVNAYIGANYFNNVPLLTYIYPDLTKSETKLHDLVIHKNLFHQKTNFGGEGTGILYYQSFRDGDNLEFKSGSGQDDLKWDNSFGDVKNFIMYENEFYSDSRDRITISGRAKAAYENNQFIAYGNVYHHIVKNKIVNYNTSGNYSIPEQTKGFVENLIAGISTSTLYNLYKNEPIPYYSPIVDKFYLKDLSYQADVLLNKIFKQNMVGNSSSKFSIQSFNQLIIENRGIKKILFRANVTQDEINLAYTKLDEALKKLEPGKDDGTNTPILKPDEPTDTGKPIDTDKPTDLDKPVESEQPAETTEEDINGALTHTPYITGYEDGTIRPNDYITRAEIAVILDRVLEKKAAHINTFIDVQESNWYADSVNNVVGLGIVEGYPDNTFRGNEYIKRSEFSAIIARISDLDAKQYEVKALSDVSTEHWANSYINYAASKGYLKGYEDGTFRPNQNLTRAEAIVVINRLLERVPDKNYIDQNHTNFDRYQDISSQLWAYYDIIEATEVHNYKYGDEGKEIWQ